MALSPNNPFATPFFFLFLLHKQVIQRHFTLTVAYYFCFSIA